MCVVYPFEDLSFALKVPSLIRPKGRMAASLADLQGIQKHGPNTFFSSLFVVFTHFDLILLRFVFICFIIDQFW
jgi:hypothetical protein